MYFAVCPKTIGFLPSKIPDPMSCYIPDFCTGVECCAEIPMLGLGLHAYVYLDLDKLELRYGLETITGTLKLFNYDWGDTIKIAVAQDLIYFSYDFNFLVVSMVMK